LPGRFAEVGYEQVGSRHMIQVALGDVGVRQIGVANGVRMLMRHVGRPAG
jgi:hypothetical protein